MIFDERDPRWENREPEEQQKVTVNITHHKVKIAKLVTKLFSLSLKLNEPKTFNVQLDFAGHVDAVHLYYNFGNYDESCFLLRSLNLNPFWFECRIQTDADNAYQDIINNLNDACKKLKKAHAEFKKSQQVAS
ncbi:hypothetical protein [Acinetobacter bereziniae]|uniref:hypothetical protein n=1 Tax=Acinetobacter bereziniae TaxID=106648 RepID=UPI003016F9C3